MTILGIDVGGTFTDAVLLDGGELRTAKVPAHRLAERRIAELCARRGRERAAAAMDKLLRYSERRVRAGIAALPDGRYETIGGGQGACPDADGPSGVHVAMSNTLNTPVEALELAYPLRVERYVLRIETPGGGGSIRQSVKRSRRSA